MFQYLSMQKDMKIKIIWTIPSSKWLGKWFEFYNTEWNTDKLYEVNYLFVESRPILFYCTQTKHNFHSFVHQKKK